MRRALLIVAVLTAVVVPAEAGAAKLRGTVVAKQRANDALVVAGRDGVARTVFAETRARVGATVVVTARRLPGGMFDASRVRITGRASAARFRGVVVRRIAGTTFFSAGSSVVSVRSSARRLFAATDKGPGPGTVADVGVTIGAGGVLTASSITPTGHRDSVVIQAIVTAVTQPTATTAGSLTLSVNGQTLVIPLPAGTTVPPTVVPGAAIMLTISFRNGGAVGGNPRDDDRDDDTDESDDSDDTNDTDDTTDDSDDD